MVGSILHEDYQRDLYLSLENSTLTGRIFTGTVDTWNAFCQNDKCENYIIDPEGYHTAHGTHVTIGVGAVWTVTGDSTLNDLEIKSGGSVTAPAGKTISATVDGNDVELKIGTYHGDIRITVTE